VTDLIGYLWLIERYGLTVSQRLRVETAIGPFRAEVSSSRIEQRTVQELLRPVAPLAGIRRGNVAAFR